MRNNLFLFMVINFLPLLCLAQFPQSDTPPFITPPLTADGQCFDMSVNYVQGINGTCIEISLDIHGNIGNGNTIAVSDGRGNYTECALDCTFVWCYSFTQPTLVNIACTTTAPNGSNSCNKSEGCIVVVAGGG